MSEPQAVAGSMRRVLDETAAAVSATPKQKARAAKERAKTVTTIGTRAAPEAAAEAWLRQQNAAAAAKAEAAAAKRQKAMVATAARTATVRADAQARAVRRAERELECIFKRTTISSARQRARDLKRAIAAGESLADQNELMARRDYRGIEFAQRDGAFEYKVGRLFGSSAKPWLAEGISRATWYRRQTALKANSA